RPGHRMSGLASARRTGPWEVLARVAPHDVALLPRHPDQFRRDTMHVHDRVRAEVADSRLELHATVRLDDEQSIETDRPGRIRADRHTGPAHRRSRPLAAARDFFLPVEDLSAFVERVFDERAGHVLTLTASVRGAELRLAFRRVDFVNGDLIDPELA